MRDGFWRAVVPERATLVAARVRLADTFWARLRGLLGRPLAEGEGLLLTPCNAVHTCFLRRPVHAVFLDGEGRVLAAESLPPWRFQIVRGARQVLELSPETAARARLAPGDRVVLEPQGTGVGREG